MSDYRSMRIKKTIELEEAISNVRKDLYEWKPADSSSSTSSKLSISSRDGTSSALRTAQTTPSFPAPPTRVKPLQTALKLKRTNSLKDLGKPPVLRPLTGPQSIHKDFDLLIIEDLSDSSSNDFNSRPKPVANSERPYLNTVRRHLESPVPASFRDPSDREAELVNYIFNNCNA